MSDTVPTFDNAMQLAGWVFTLPCFEHVVMDGECAKQIAAAVEKYAPPAARPERMVFSKLRSEADVKVTVSETEEDGKVRVQVDTCDAGLQAIMECEGWTREQQGSDE